MPQHQSLSPVSAGDTKAALIEALAIRADDGVPLVVDPRTPIDPELLSAPLPDAAAWAALTSGTTGAPKIVVRTADSWRASFEHLNNELDLGRGDGLWMPVHQVSSMAVFSAAWAHESGLNLVIPQPDELGLDQSVAAHVTPVWLDKLLQYLEAGKPSTIHTVLVGGDRLTPTLMARANDVGLRVIPYVGAAELSFVAWDTGQGLRAFPGVDLFIDDDAELWVSSPQTALQILGGTLRRRVDQGSEWVTVGDRVAKHPNGVLEFQGRADKAILTAGATVVPTDVEAVINAHPAVTASLVVGQPDAVLGQRVVACVESSAPTAELRTWVRSRLPKAAQPVQWHRVDRLARTASGKIRRVVPEEF